MKLKPLGERIVLKTIEPLEKTKSGIFLPKSSDDRKQGEVVDVGEMKDGRPIPLQKGDKVLVYRIGSGFEAKLILDRVGREGSIIGVDFSEGMLKLAQEMVDRNNWSNVKLVMADVREYDPLKDVNHKFDAALSNFGYLDKMVLYNLVNAVKAGGMIAISGPQPLKGIRKIFYPITFVPEMIFGLTWRTLHKFPMYIDILRNELTNIHIDERTFAKYFVAVSGRRK